MTDLSLIDQPGCAFCEITYRDAPATLHHSTYRRDSVVAFQPLNPVVEGHWLVVPRQHLTDALSMPFLTGHTFQKASELANEIDADGHWNFITSKGRHATQSVYHFHVHLIPRRENDGLALPWYSGKR